VGGKPVRSPKEFHKLVSGMTGAVQLRLTDHQSGQSSRAMIGES
jgi:hypothetical protein